MWDKAERRQEVHECPLSAEDAYQLIFEMKETKKKLVETGEKMDKLCSRMTKFEELYHEGKGMAAGIKIGGVLVISAIIGVIILIWSAITGKIQFSDILKLI